MKHLSRKYKKRTLRKNRVFRKKNKKIYLFFEFVNFDILNILPNFDFLFIRDYLKIIIENLQNKSLLFIEKNQIFIQRLLRSAFTNGFIFSSV